MVLNKPARAAKVHVHMYSDVTQRTLSWWRRVSPAVWTRNRCHCHRVFDAAVALSFSTSKRCAGHDDGIIADTESGFSVEPIKETQARPVTFGLGPFGESDLMAA